jgi:hypothetical protein
MRRDLVGDLILMALIAAGFVLLAAWAARAHEWYPPECCSERDCAPVAARDVIEGNGGWTITVRAGAHPQLPRGGMDRAFFVPYRAARPSPDGRAHICLGATLTVLCAFTPQGGT